MRVLRGSATKGNKAQGPSITSTTNKLVMLNSRGAWRQHCHKVNVPYLAKVLGQKQTAPRSKAPSPHTHPHGTVRQPRAEAHVRIVQEHRRHSSEHAAQTAPEQLPSGRHTAHRNAPRWVLPRRCREDGHVQYRVDDNLQVAAPPYFDVGCRVPSSSPWAIPLRNPLQDYWSQDRINLLTLNVRAHSCNDF